jgi:release factor glutamine methyltransferase
MLTIAEALAQARSLGVDRLDAQLLLAACTQRSRAWLIAHDDTALAPPQTDTCLAWLRRRAAGEPVAYILGEKEFHGLMLTVNASVLVPRPDTETLVDWAIELLRGRPTPSQVVDLGTGSGAIALAIKHAMPQSRVTALDESAAALDVARANGEKLGLDVVWKLGHWWDAVGQQRFDLAVSNPPYIAEGDEHLDALGHEPLSALTAGLDGLDDIRRIVADATQHLHPGGWLLLEHGHDQAGAVADLLASAGFVAVQSRTDLAGIARCTGARTPQ